MAATQYFIESYYAALNTRQEPLSSFYISPCAMTGGKSLPSISFNGDQIRNATALQVMFEDQIPAAYYEVKCYDCHVVNSNYVAENTEGWPPKTGKNMTILVAVSGCVTFGHNDEAKKRGFSETFLLVPNPVAAANKQRAKDVKEWIIQTQNFRVVV
ncbi:MAG: hypothetical protein LQ352_002366 [Teloschistes flavicans]|nr:MAG: hypothetical protein LQ352_002366 [Teloschistes flavicans]